MIYIVSVGCANTGTNASKHDHISLFIFWALPIKYKDILFLILLYIIFSPRQYFPHPDKHFNKLSDQELKELLLINMYKLALTRAQLEAITNILIKKKLATFEEIWKDTNENFKNTI